MAGHLANTQAAERLRAALQQDPPLLTPTAAPAPAPSLGPSVSGYPTYLAHLSQLIPLQRALLLLNLQKAHYFYAVENQDRLHRLGWADTPEVVNPPRTPEDGAAEDDGGELKEVKDLLTECGLWGLVRDKEDEAEAEIASWTNAPLARPDGEFQVVQVSGMPFMLHLPPGYTSLTQTPPPLDAYKSLKRAQAILHILTTMLQLLVVYQPSTPAIAYGRSLLRAPTASGAGHAAGAAAGGQGGPDAGAAAAAAGAGAGAAGGTLAARRRATVSIVINLEAMVQILVPLLLLSVKLGFLLWIFGRHASPTKRMVLGGMAVLYVVWEGWSMTRRRAALARDRERLERARRVAVAAAANRPVGVPAEPRRAGGGGEGRAGGGAHRRARAEAAAAAGGAAPGAPAQNAGGGAGGRGAELPAPRLGANGHPRPSSRARPPTSRLSPRYWLNWIAAIGLAEEARELGLVPRSIAGRPVVNPPTPPPAANDRAGRAALARRRAIRTAIVAVVLFFGTLSPEVEKKRKRALEKRERLLAQRKAARERKAAVAALAAAGAAGGGVGGGEQHGAAGGAGLGADLVAAGGGAPASPSGASTPGVFEADQAPLTTGFDESRASATGTSELGNGDASTSTSAGGTTWGGDPAPSTTSAASSSTSIPTSTSTVAEPVGGTHAPTAIPSPPAAGRQVISDAELFADGLGEPEQVVGVAGDEMDGEDERERREQEQAIAEGRVDDNETDEEGEEGRDGEGEGEVDQIVALF